jgi:hypothetical protein
VRAEHIHPWMFLSSDWGESLLYMGSAGTQNGKASCDCNRWAHGCQFRAQLPLTLLESWGDTARWKCAIFVLCSVFGPNCRKKVQKNHFLHEVVCAAWVIAKTQLSHPKTPNPYRRVKWFCVTWSKRWFASWHHRSW